MRLLRALSLPKPVLLEGSPGVGKTSLVAALAAAAGHALVRINLSEQSDMMDLLGADLPAAGGGAAEFSWADGPLLTALRTGAWVLLDELNLAPQAVLEGLNALLDHRREVYVPELDTVRCLLSGCVWSVAGLLRACCGPFAGLLRVCCGAASHLLPTQPGPARSE
jgi:midasin